MWFARVWLHALACRDCGYSELEAFSCKRRRLCISPRTSHGPIRLCVLKRVCCLAFSQVECPAHSDHDTKDLEEPEATFDALEQFVDATLEHVESADAKVIDAYEEREFSAPFGKKVSVDFTGRTNISKFALPNFLFHVVTAHNILRHNGVELGMRTYLGPFLAG